MWISPKGAAPAGAGGEGGLGRRKGVQGVRIVMDERAVGHTIARLAHEIVERFGSMDDVALVGLRSRGDALASRIAEIVRSVEGVSVPLGFLDISFYRDDLPGAGYWPAIQDTRIDFDVQDRRILLVDDVLFTGRTVRAALDALVDLGRPRCVQLAVLVDRGHRELPIAADYVGKRIQTKRDEHVVVHLKEIDGEDLVAVESPAGKAGG